MLEVPYFGGQIYGNFQGFPEKNMVHEVWVGVMLHDPLICMGPMGAKPGKGVSSPKGNFQQVTDLGRNSAF